LTKAKTILSELKAGNERFLSSDTHISSASSLQKLKEYAASGQTPKAIVLCCSDSRAPVEFIFDQDIGDLFVIRIAGNIVAPSIVGSVEYAASTFGSPLMLVMGHSGCGAVQATLDSLKSNKTSPSENIQDIVRRIKPHIATVASIKSFTDEQKMELCVQANVRASVANLSHGSRILENLIRTGALTVVGAVLDLDTGKVEFLED
jgi:carbonic anhydrase